MDKVEEPTTEEERLEKFRQARAILNTAASSMSPTGHAERLSPYLKGRGINIPAPASLMYLSVEQSRALGKIVLGFKQYPAMVAPIVNDGRLQGAHVTYLTHDGRHNLQGKDGKNIRRIYGTAKGYVGLGVIDPEQPPDVVDVGEGIETALSAAQLTGHPALAVPGGNYISITPPRSAKLIITADNDANGVGMEKANKAADFWVNGRSVQIAAPSQHTDWNDALRDPNADPDELCRLILSAKQFEGCSEVRALTMEEVIELDFPPREYLLQPWLETGSLAMLHAARGMAKTRLAMSVSYAVATGQPLLTWSAPRPARVLYVDGELPAALLQQRLRVLGPPTPNLLFIARDILMRESRVTIPDLAEPAGRGRDFLDGIIEQYKPDLIVLDSLSTLFRSGVENDAESWTFVQDWLLSHRFQGRTIILIHHEGKSGSPRGTSKREDVLDTIIRLKERRDLAADDEAAFELSFTKTREFHGIDAASLILRLSTKSGSAVWTHELERDHSRERASALRKQGMTQQQIADELEITQGRVSQILRETARDAENINSTPPRPR